MREQELMLYLLLYPLRNDYGFFNLFRYTTSV